MVDCPVIITRPGSRAEPLAAAIQAYGLEVERMEVMTQEVVPESAGMRAVWLDIDQFHKVVVISPAAAECLIEALDRYWPQLPQGLALYAVGEATASVLHQALGVRVRMPSVGHETSEGLLALGSLRQLGEQKVLLVAGQGGRTLLADTLAERGARVTRLEVYRRRLMEPSRTEQWRLSSAQYRALVVSSGEILEHLARWCSKTALYQPLIVSSQRLATLAEQLGFRDVVVASGASPAAMAAAAAGTCNPR